MSTLGDGSGNLGFWSGGGCGCGLPVCLQGAVTIPSVEIPELLARHRSIVDTLNLVHVALRESPAEAPQPVLSTKLGGVPDLPPGMPWPAGDDGDPAPFGFQVNFTDLAARFPGLLPWPAGGGLIQFFIGYKHPTVVTHRDLSALRPTAGPVDELREYRIDPVVGVWKGNDIPASGRQALEQLRGGLTAEENAALQRLLAGDPPTHQVGGSAWWIQDCDMWAATYLERGMDPIEALNADGGDDWATDTEYYEWLERPYADGWRLMLTFGTMDDSDYWFGDLGVFYFVAPLDAAGHWNIDRTQVIYQSH